VNSYRAQERKHSANGNHRASHKTH
jgi:hypothetical protein